MLNFLGTMITSIQKLLAKYFFTTVVQQNNNGHLCLVLAKYTYMYIFF